MTAAAAKVKSLSIAKDLGAGLTIEPHVLYPLQEFKRRVGWGQHALRTAKANGLTVRYTANRGYVHGKDFIAYVVGGNTSRDSAESALD